MLKSLYSGVSGMGANQTKLDVIGNNIANASTTAFKSSRVRFQDALSQTVIDANVPTANQGGTNAAQLGSGVQLAGIDTIMKQGPIQNTGRNLDAAIDGEGYFIVGSGPTIFGDNAINVNQSTGQHNVDENSLSQSGMNLMYTRDGSFTLDNQGNLLSSDGLRIMGYSLTNDNSTTDPTAKEPNAVTAGGFNFQFGPGEALNGYTVVLGKIGAGTLPTATVDTANNKIVLNGDFSDAGKFSSSAAQTAINSALSASGIAQTVSVTGESNPIYGTSSPKVTGGVDAQAPANVSAGGFTFSFNQGTQFNGYTIRLGNISNPTLNAVIDQTNKIITLNGNFTTGTITSAQLQSALSTALSGATPAFATGASISVAGSSNTIPISDAVASGTVSYRGMTFNFTDTATGTASTAVNGYTLRLGDINTNPSTATLDPGNVITINGNPNSMSADDYVAAIQGAAGFPAGVTVSRTTNSTPSQLSNTKSNLIIGGVDAADAGTVSSGGFNFTFGPGTQLNGYKINIGTISQGTQVSVDVNTDESDKTITINGDFVTNNAIDANQLETVINNALNQKGIKQTIGVTGNPINITGSISGNVAGGTPQESIGTSGIINFVDGSKEVYSYDGSLKSLRIPDTVYDAATDTYLKVKTFSIGKDGVITATLDGGKVAALGQIAMAQFKNPVGLTKEGGNVYSASIASGGASLRSGINTKGEDNSALYGDVRQNALEGSNVDLAEQFTDMIVASRAFQANGKTISTGDEILQDIINLKR